METRFKEIVDGCRKGNRKDQQALYDFFSRKMYRVCLSYVSESEDAMDILHDSFIKIFAKLAQYDSIQQLEAWIRMVTVNTAIDFIRRKKKIVYLENDDYRLEQMQTDPTGEKMESRDLDALIDLLPNGARTVFNLYAIEGYNHREIADRLEISEGTSKSQLSRARQLLQDLLKIHYPQAHG
ncbi:MAG: RNA polymerase sigma-70 factor, ECF subfamily [Bacteroidetes bacterium]|nr:MAG: RNA polymerase sigma-70 factor, ECF subfamily [Bacteroidota bacterium]